VIVGDAGEILPQIKPYAQKIEIFDAEGKSIDAATYSNANTSAANVNGKWNLTVEAQGQQLPVTLMLKQDGGKVSGSLDSMMGKGDISEAKVNGNKFVGTAKTQIQGQAMDLVINGTVDGDSMKGTITLPIPGAPPFSFTGTKAKE
jgi:hypothetical protein